MQTTEEQLFWAYRLAKFEVTGERRGVGRRAFAEFEQVIDRRLRTLAARGPSLGRTFREVIPGRIWLRPKGVERVPRHPDSDTVVMVPERASDHQIGDMSIRVLLEPTPEFAICEVMWLLTFGSALEAVVATSCRANRLDLKGVSASIAVGGRAIFKPWGKAYQKYRRGALTKARRLLGGPGERCVLSVLDLAAYYDNIDASFLVDPVFVDLVERAARSRNIRLDVGAYLEATNGLLDAFRRYRDSVQAVVGIPAARGIPIGSLSSRVIANLALIELDRHIASQPSVRHYARYVDDILVVEDPEQDWESTVAGVVSRLLPLRGYEQGAQEIVLDEQRLLRPDSSFTIQRAKLRIFDLQGEQGLEYLGSVQAEMERMSSDRRRFLELRADELEQTVMASPDGEPIRALREADALSLRRYAVNTAAYKVETAAAMLERVEAARFCRDQLGMAGRLATEWSRWVELLDVSLHILGVALLSGDADTSNEVVAAILKRAESLDGSSSLSFRVHWNGTTIEPVRASETLQQWLGEQLVEVVCGAAPFDEMGFLLKGVRALAAGIHVTGRLIAPAALLENARLLSSADLRLADRETDLRGGTVRATRSLRTMLRLRQLLVTDAELRRRLPGIEAFLAACRDQHDPCYGSMGVIEILLMRRPPTYVDIMFRWLRAEKPVSMLLDVVNAVRGTRYTSASMSEHERTLIVVPPTSEERSTDTRPRVVLGNLCTEDAWWQRSLTSPFRDVDRQLRLARVVNQAADAARRTNGRPTLLVLPELSLPRAWLREVTRHLSHNAPSLSLVAGLEYDVVHGKVYNEAVAFFPRPFFSAAGWIWTKRRVAHHEKTELKRVSFSTRGERRRFVVVSSEHGRLIALICSELLEVDTRAQLLGRVDLVVVPAWNPDTTSFEYFVHASTLELHAFVAIANNGKYSDCRIRGPYAEQWRRDLCRLITRGENETVVADLDIESLREYRTDPKEYDTRRSAWIKHEKETAEVEKRPAQECPWPAWKPVPPGMNET